MRRYLWSPLQEATPRKKKFPRAQEREVEDILEQDTIAEEPPLNSDGNLDEASTFQTPEEEKTSVEDAESTMKDKLEELHESEEEFMDFPDNMDDFVTLDELDNDGGNFDSAESSEGGKVVTVRRIRKGYGLEEALLKLAEPFGKVTNHAISFYRQEALLELESNEAAKRMIKFYEESKKALIFGRPVSVSMCHTLQKLEGPSGRSVYIGMLPLQKYSDISLLRLAQPFGKISAYHLNWRHRMCYIQMETADAAQKMVQKYLQRPPKFYGSVLRICLCRKGDSQIPWRAPTKYELWCAQNKLKKSDKETLELEVENGQSAESPAAQKTPTEEDVKSTVSDSDGVSSAPASDTPSGENGDKDKKTEHSTDTTPVPLGPYQPDNPVGIDYIVQRTGFFCKLCKVFYTNEKTAKSLHCSSLAHYQKLKKKLAEGSPKE
ncbi:hypothetical protein AGOR_G00018590 [Albula goreensis]|uniref:Matrin-type domain-containing protein n=1 Tax=Albula goreensis TaxID=1534307 RepID=A0A8T3E788_9TELE|nr:hypothetical protein AGOR_G00018590 [Albula goreensis]